MSATGAFLATSVVTVAADGITLVRTRGRLVLSLESATAGINGFWGAFGIGVATSAAIAAGAASVPTPITEQDWDGWLYWTAVQVYSSAPLDSGAAADLDNLSGRTAVQQIEIDSKAMRKLDVQDGLYGCLEVTEQGTAAMSWSVDTRILLKLP